MVIYNLWLSGCLEYWLKLRHLQAAARFPLPIRLLESSPSFILVDETDVCHLLLDLKISDFKERKHSNITDEWLYIFLISVEDCQIYLKLILRNNCLIISFHEDRPNE